jgi:uncharacterized protein YaeQ
MALTATVLNFAIELVDIDRNVYDTLEFRLAQHPSENAQRVAVRVLARAMAHEENLEFGRGLSHVEDPTLWSKGPQGQITHWVDVGGPSAQRLHRASKQADRVSVYTDKNLTSLKKEWMGERIHRSEDILLVLFDSKFTDALAEGVDRQNKWIVTINEGYLSVVFDNKSVDSEPEKTTIADFLGRT